jgi:hypothetical protein
MGRFILYVSMTFVTVFVAVTWAARGFPVNFSKPSIVQPLQPTLTTTFGDNSAEKKREQLAEQQLQDPDNAKRNPLRADALQAATGYALSPCDKTMKANLVAAMRAYAMTFYEIHKCNPMFTNCDPAFDKAIATYSTPYDMRVRNALHEAFEKGGISKADFPPELQMSVMSLANSTGSTVSACETSARRDRR